jgi:hypothetical protein
MKTCEKCVGKRLSVKNGVLNYRKSSLSKDKLEWKATVISEAVEKGRNKHITGLLLD